MTAVRSKASLWHLLLIGAPLLVYLNSLDNPFQYDDFHSIVENPHIRERGNIPRFFTDPTLFSVRPENAMYRPLLLTSFALNYAISGYRVWSYHLLTMLLHIACVLLLFEIGVLSLKDRRVAGFSALFFGLHPVNAEAVNYISSRSEVLGGVFLLLGIYLFLRSGADGKKGIWLAGVYLGGLLSKSIVIVLPAIFAAYDLIAAGRRPWKRVGLYAPTIGVALVYLVAIRTFLRRAVVGEPVRSFTEQFWTQTKGWVFYLKLLIWPSGLSVDHQFLISDTLFDPFAATAFVFLLSLIGLALYHRRRHPLPLFLLCAMGITLAPSSLIPLNVLVNEHRLYVPSALFALGVGYFSTILIERAGGWKKGIEAFAVIALAGLAIATWMRNQVWSDAYTLWKDAADKAPLMARPYIFLGDIHDKDGNRRAAIVAFEEALRRDPGYTPIHARLGTLYLEAGMPVRAEEVLQRGIGLDAENGELWATLGDAFRDQGRWSECVEAYRRAVGLSDSSAALRNNLGNALQMVGLATEALAEHRRALALAPGDARTWLNIGNAHLMLRENEDALEAYRRAVEIDPRYAEGWLSLGNLYERSGSVDEALSAYERAVDIAPEYADFVRKRRQIMQSGE